MESTWRNAIIRVLREAQMPLDYREISTLILTQGYYETEGATPHATVNAQITASIKHDGAATPFIKVGKGVFGLKEVLGTIIQVDTPKTLSKPDASVTEAEVESSDSIIQSFGMYWQRDLVVWRGEPKMFGKQQAQAKAVDFGRQKGIYILYTIIIQLCMLVAPSIDHLENACMSTRPIGLVVGGIVSPGLDCWM
jgi:hypothetical protein